MDTKKPYMLGVITARGGSKGLPRKNVRLLNGKPLIAYTIEAAQKSELLTRAIVSTEDDAIAKVALAHNADVPFKRPKELAQDDTAIFPVLRHATLEVEAQDNVTVDGVILLQPTSPFRVGADIDTCIKLLGELNAEVVMTVSASEASPYYNLIEQVPNTPWVKLCMPPNEILNRRQEAPKTWTVHGACYAYTREALFNYEHHLRMKRPAIYEMPEERILDIDTERDLLFADWLLANDRVKI